MLLRLSMQKIKLSFWLGAVHKRRRNSFWPFLNPNPPCRNFDADLPNFYLLISCNIGISDPLPPKIFKRLLWMPPYVLEFFKTMWFYFPCTASNFWDFFRMDTDQVNKHICLLLMEWEECWKKVIIWFNSIQNKEIETDN